MVSNKYRVNRAVGMFSKGDEFTSEPDHPMIESLLGAGYAEMVLDDRPELQSNEPINPEPGGDDEAEVQ